MYDRSLAGEMLAAYQAGISVDTLCLTTGLKEADVLIRLCAAARCLASERWTVLDDEGALGVQWEFVFWRG